MAALLAPPTPPATPGARNPTMPEKKVIEAARRDKAQGKSASVQAGEFVREEIHKIRRGEHGARSEHARKAAARRSPAERSASAQKAVRTKGVAGRTAAARKAARTRSRHGR